MYIRIYICIFEYTWSFCGWLSNIDPFRQPPRKFEITGLFQPVTSNKLPCIFEVMGCCVTHLLSNIAIISSCIAEYSDIIAKFDRGGPSNIENGIGNRRIFDITWLKQPVDSFEFTNRSNHLIYRIWPLQNDQISRKFEVMFVNKPVNSKLQRRSRRNFEYTDFRY